MRVRPPEPDLHAAPLGRELDRVREQIPHDLLEPLGIARDGADLGVEYRLQLDGFGCGCRPHDLDRCLDDAGEMNGAYLDTHLAGDDAGHFEQVVDDLRLAPGAPLDRLLGAACRFLVECPLTQQPRPR